MKTKSKRSLALLLISALLAGILPLSGSAPVQAAGYGLNNPKTDADGVTTWDCIWFGNYWQEDTNKDGKADKEDDKTPIKWRVLSVEGDDAFLLADKNIDVQRYNKNWVGVTWETCTMRSWLNGYGAEKNQPGEDFRTNNFLDNAFSVAEQSAIKATNVVNNDNPECETEGGNDTSDKVYLLSIDEVTNPEYGFTSSTNSTDTRKAVNTAYVAGGGEIKSSSSGMSSAGSADHWWLRSPGYYSRDASYVNYYGSVNTMGDWFFVNYYAYAARPALHLKLKASSDAIAALSWSYAGTVTSEGGETPSPTEPGNTQKPQETAAPLVPSQPGNASVAPSAPQPGTPVISAPGISSDPGKSTVGKVSSLKLKQKKRTVTASWKKLTRAKGYQICYSTSKKWRNKKQKLVSKNKAVIKNLKKKKTYYFRVRAYRLEGTKKVYGAWSNTKKIKIKK